MGSPSTKVDPASVLERIVPGQWSWNSLKHLNLNLINCCASPRPLLQQHHSAPDSSWRLSRQVRERYGVQLTRLITGRGGVRQVITPGGMRRQAKYQLRPEVAHAQVLKLAAHLGRYPGLGGGTA